MSSLQYSESIVVARSPEALYDMVSDVTRMGEWSPVCKACWWDDGDGPRAGAWFTGRNELPERTWETRSQVVAADRGREFAFEVNSGWVRWGYTFTAVDSGTQVTESWEFLPAGISRVPRPVRRRCRGPDREPHRGRAPGHSCHPRRDQEGRGSGLTSGYDHPVLTWLDWRVGALAEGRT